MLNGCVPRPRQLTRGVFNTPHEPPVSCHGFHGFAKIHPLFPHTKERISGQSITLIFNTLDKENRHMRIVRLHYNACVGRYPAQNLLNEFTFSLKSSQNCKALQCFDLCDTCSWMFPMEASRLRPHKIFSTT